MDVKLTTKSGKIVHIEIQVLELPEMPERITYYNSKILVTQLKSGCNYDALQKTISIAIIDFEMIKDSPAYHHIFQMYDKPTGVKFTDLVEIHVLELRKVPDRTDNTQKYNWLQFLRAEKEEDFMIAAEKNPVIQKAFVELKRLSQDEEAQRMAENREKAIRDEYARNQFAYANGIKEGAREKKMQIAKEMLKDGLEIGMVAKYTELSHEELQNL